jgi:RNA 3'-terminal phosphate cyclase-like protein
MSTREMKAGSTLLKKVQYGDNVLPTSRRSPGFGLTLLAESTTSTIYGAEYISTPGITPEEVALNASRLLLQAIQGGGCVDQNHQCLVMLLMVLGSEDVGQCRIGSLTERS